MKRTALLICLVAASFACRSTDIALNSTADFPNAEPQQATAPTPRVLTKDEIERKIEVETKMLKGEYLHDGSLELSSIGDIESVPALLVVVRKYPTKGGAMICTKAHALSALIKITGQNLGDQPEPWEDWWKDNKSSK